MNLIKINPAESILEAWFDGGESYEGHQKYAALTQYTVTVPNSVKAAVKQGWCAVDVSIYSGAEAVTLERSCDLDISGFDRFCLAMLPSNVRVRIVLTTDAGEFSAEKTYTENEKDELWGALSGTQLHKLRLEVCLADACAYGNAALVWLSLADSRCLAQKEKPAYRFSPDWPGCFQKDYEIGPEIGIYFGKDQLAAMRQKVQKPPFDKIYAVTRESVYARRDFEPEALIEEYLINENRLMCRPGHMHRSLLEGLQDMCFVGVIEEDRELIRLAGRTLLSIAVTPHWCESFMGNLPGATWHHRSFLEGLACKRCAIALDLIGSSLSWHGKNLVYDAIIQKGLPRVEADMFTMEYVRHCNQGVVFNDDRIFAYIALAKQYPRYEKMLEIAEADFNDMVEKYVLEDGGSLEGPGYWGYTVENVAETAIVLARYRNKPVKDYVSPRLRRMADYILAVTCQRPEGYRYMLLNDTYSHGWFNAYTLNFLYQVSGEPFMGGAVTQSLKTDGGLENLLMVDSDPALENAAPPQGLICLHTSGFTCLRQSTRAGQQLQLFLRSGKAYFSHFHEDKGQLLLFAGDEELLCDRGNSSAVGKKPVSHNLFVPEREGLPYSQRADGCDAKVLAAQYENGIFLYKTDLHSAWESGIFESITRTVTSQQAGEYVLTDCAQCVESTAMSQRFHSIFPIEKQGDAFVVTAPKSRLLISPVNYALDCYEIKADGKRVTGEQVYQLVLRFPKAKSHQVTTRLKVE